jgi:hypothetical protein
MNSGENHARSIPPIGGNVPRGAILLLLFTTAAIVEGVWLSCLQNPAVWFHLRAGAWILANKTWPTTGLFSQSAGLPWRDFAWLSDAFMAMGYRILGLSAIPALWMFYRGSLGAVLFLLAGGSRGNFWLPGVLSATTQYLLYDLGPVGRGNSAIFFALELFVLMHARRTGNYRFLLFLPPLFVLWTNIDLGLVYGLGLYVLFLIAIAVEKARMLGNTESEHHLAPGITLLVGAACFVGTLVSPYGYHAYPTFLAIQGNAANSYLANYTAMTFHQPQDYVLLLVTMIGFLTLGVRRSRDVLLLGSLIASAAFSFYAQREAWLVAIVAIAVVGNAFRVEANSSVEERKLSLLNGNWMFLPGSGAAGIIALSFFLLVPRQERLLLARAAKDFPVGACEYIRQQRLPAPLFNSYQWGGFVVWYLPEYPVAIDGRRGLYPEDVETDYFKVMKVQMPYQAFSPMARARTLLMDKQNVVGDALRTVPGFRVAYEDRLSLVLVQESQGLFSRALDHASAAK